ncbi:site-specific DNA-methyltransferase [Dysgonomonas sp. 521]|uniref:site-specific DNA-methyltransferase n=1 Tax=Dysgonomonas sp. 521 TaxID=2302932 RepID=UPI0013D865F1|nr:site-specific DNA-methyltransferase [Dysgonomonas sp. 521]NDV94847.1 site-specific DNA-methyltransferase [Dysgonomonas sp. 521]
MEIIQLGNITAIHGDSQEYIKTLPDKCFDLAFPDPQYDINATNMSMGQTKGYESTAKRVKKGRLNSGGGKLKNRILNQSDIAWDDAPPPSEYFDHLFRISHNQIIWGGNYFPLPPTRGIIAWDKKQPWTNFSQFELAWTSFDKPARLYSGGSRGGDNIEKKIHPTQKPVWLYKAILIDYATPGMRIIDTHGGSFSLAIACHDLGYELTIFEKDKFNFDNAVNRLKWHQRQTQLFTGREQQATHIQTSFLE